MALEKMHENEVYTDAALVRRLIAAQFPTWAALPIEPVASAGTDNALYRFGSDKVVRLPRIYWAAGQVEKEQTWLPRLSSQLPVDVPTPFAKGVPGEGYPWNWSVYRWLDGEVATTAKIADLGRFATDLATFITVLRNVDSSGGPAPDANNSFRGVPLEARDTQTRSAIASLAGTVDTAVAIAAWEDALRAPAWVDPPVWIHGDLQPGNLLVSDGRLNAVIDFGCLAVGDPACDLMAAWNVLTAENRARFRESVSVDDATWARGRGWALSVGLVALPYYHRTNPVLAAIARNAIDAAIADYRRDK